MPSPLPGMDPYLEHPSAWPNIHHRLITAIADVLASQLLPKYQVVVEERIYQLEGDDSILIGAPDVTVLVGSAAQRLPVKDDGAIAVAEPTTVTLMVPETVRLGYLEVREIRTGQVVTVIEVLSPVNKRPGRGRVDYESKRSMIFGSSCNFVEIDLLRQWQSLPVQTGNRRSSYRILVSPQEKRPEADLYAFELWDLIPCFPLPLRSEDVCPVVDLKVLIDGIYDRSGYGLVIEYDRPAVPPLSEEQEGWLRDWFKTKG
jgi:hypothetical protein